MPRRDYVAVARLRSAVRTFERASEKAARDNGLTPQRYLLLLMVKGAPDGSERALVSDIAARLQLADHTVTGALSRAEAAGLVSREPSSDDRRRRWVRLTREGERRLAATVDALARRREELVAAIDQIADAGADAGAQAR